MSHHQSAFRSWLPLGGLALLLLPSVASAQGETGFLRGRGKLDLVVGFTEDSYDEFWVGSDKMSAPPVGEVTRQGYGVYGAYGATDDLDLILSASYISVESDGSGGFSDQDDLQDLLLAAKWRVVERMDANGGGLSVALLPGVKVPMTDYEDNDVTAIGDGQVDLRGRVVVQYQLPSGAFAALETGYDRRNGSPKDEIPLHLMLGATVKSVTISPFLSRIESTGGTDIGAPGGFTPNEEDITRAGVSLYWRLGERFGLTGSWRTTLDGRNTGDVDGYSLGVVVRML